MQFAFKSKPIVIKMSFLNKKSLKNIFKPFKKYFLNIDTE